MKNLNGIKGATISELEALLIVSRKLLKEKLKENPKAGIIIAKGEPGEARFRYRDLLFTVDSVQAKFGLEGCFSLGVCKTCSKFTPSENPSYMGDCPIKGRVHEFSSCDKRSKSGCGYGLK